MRYFCPSIGRVVETDEDDEDRRHAECGWTWWAHPEATACGETAPCGDHGHPCELSPSHDGPHRAPGCGDG